MAGGVKLGAIESVIGFVNQQPQGGGGFGIAMMRRIMRMLARIFLVVGTAKGYVVFFFFFCVIFFHSCPLVHNNNKK